MFSFFGKKDLPLVRLDDVIWISQEAKWAALLENLQKSVESKPTWLIYFFERTFNTLQTLLTNLQKPYEWVQSAENLKDTSKIWIFSANEFRHLSSYLKKDFANKELSVFFAEHYPLAEEENEILKKIGDISFKAKAYVYTSFDEPILKKFSGDKILEMLKKMGAKETESLSHQLITKAIKEAQKKIGESIKHEQRAVSMEDWFAKNFK